MLELLILIFAKRTNLKGGKIFVLFDLQSPDDADEGTVIAGSSPSVPVTCLLALPCSEASSHGEQPAF